MISAADDNDANFMNFLLERGADVREKDDYGRAPLHYASWRDRPDVVQVLVDRSDQDVNVRDADLNTPLHYAISGRHSGVLSVLWRLPAGRIDLNVKNRRGHTPLHVANFGPANLIRDLLDRGALVGGEDIDSQFVHALLYSHREANWNAYLDHFSSNQDSDQYDVPKQMYDAVYNLTRRILNGEGRLLTPLRYVLARMKHVSVGLTCAESLNPSVNFLIEGQSESFLVWSNRAIRESDSYGMEVRDALLDSENGCPGWVILPNDGGETGEAGAAGAGIEAEYIEF